MRALALALALAVGVSAQSSTPKTPHPATSPQFWKMARHSVDMLLQPVPQSDKLRLAQLKQTFSDLDCGPQLREQPASRGPNLLCTLTGTPAGSDSGTILIIAHYEHQGSGESASGNWSGAITLPFLYHALAYTPRRHTFVFAEVNGEDGAKTLFESFTPDQRRKIKGVVAIDAIGLGPAEFYIDPNDVFAENQGWGFLQRQLLQAAAYQHVDPPLAAIPGGWQKVDETREFRHHGIPSILIHSVTFSTRHLPGSSSDTASAIDHGVYCNTLTLLDFFSVELDNPWPGSANNTPSGSSGGRRR